MPCGCTNNKNNNKLSLDSMSEPSISENKLSLDSMSILSIDEIINLYRQGYRLETENMPQSLSNIESMQYNQCTGNVDLDINWSSVSQQGGRYLYKESAKAIKINPTSRCLDFITFYGVRRIANVGIYVEIRQDNGNKPLGTPGESSTRLTQIPVSYSNIPTTFGAFDVDISLLLPSIGTYWIVIRSQDYSCTNAATQRLELSYHYLSENRYIVYGYSDLCSPPGCCWYGLNYDPIPIATYKKTYSAPALNSISIAPTSASINVLGTQQLTASCKDQYDNSYTCPTLTWNSSDNNKATVSSGLVTGVAAGSANITASGGGKTSNQSAITVASAITCQSISNVIANPSTLTLGGMVELTALVTPSQSTTQ